MEKAYTVGQKVSPSTPTEIRIVEMLSRGILPKEIAQVIGIKPQTLRRHLHNIRRKNQIKTISQLTRKLIEQGKIKVEIETDGV